MGFHYRPFQPLFSSSNIDCQILDKSHLTVAFASCLVDIKQENCLFQAVSDNKSEDVYDSWSSEAVAVEHKAGRQQSAGHLSMVGRLPVFCLYKMGPKRGKETVCGGLE